MSKHESSPRRGRGIVPHQLHEEAQRIGPVRRCLEQALAQASDDRLAEAEILEVVSRSGGRRVEVVVVGPPQHVLDRAVSWLRGELAQSLRRRKVPQLTLVAIEDAADDGIPWGEP